MPAKIVAKTWLVVVSHIFKFEFERKLIETRYGFKQSQAKFQNPEKRFSYHMEINGN